MKAGDPTIYRIRSVFMVKPIYYEAMGELGNIEYLPESKLSLLTDKLHDELVSDNNMIDEEYDDIVKVFSTVKPVKKSEIVDKRESLEELRNDLLEVAELKKNFISMEKFIKKKILEEEKKELQEELKAKGVGKYAK